MNVFHCSIDSLDCLSLPAEYSLRFLCKLDNQVEDISQEPQVERELMLIKINADPKHRAEVIRFSTYTVLLYSFRKLSVWCQVLSVLPFS